MDERSPGGLVLSRMEDGQLRGVRLSEVEYHDALESGKNRVHWQQTLNLLAR